MTTEALRTQLDTLRIEKQRLEVENAKLRDGYPEAAERLDSETEAARLQKENESVQQDLQHMRELYEQSLRDLQASSDAASDWEQKVGSLEKELTGVRQHGRKDLETLQGAYDEQQRQCQQLEVHTRRLEEEAIQAAEGAELERYRAVEAERQKWEAREDRLVRQLEELQKRCEASSLEREGSPQSSGRASERHADPTASPQNSGRASERQPEDSMEHESEHESEPGSNESTSAAVGRDPANPCPDQTAINTSFHAALLAQQMPPLSKFSGDERETEGETFRDWIEQFEMVATICEWSDPAKLVNLATRLKGQAYAFYRTCTPQQRANYTALVATLRKRFTPVRIQAVQSSQFHERKQGHKETVDNYAQDLRRLFYRAYPRAQQGSGETEDMGRSVLAYQFVSGLLPEIKRKVAGNDGDFEQLLTRARFEEAKLRELYEPPPNRSNPLPSRGAPMGKLPQRDGPPRSQGPYERTTGPPRFQGQYERTTGPVRCYGCGASGHISKNCRWKGRAGPTEARGQFQTPARQGKVATVVAVEDEQRIPTEFETQTPHLPDEVDAALERVMATMHGITSVGKKEDTYLGPIPTAVVKFEEVPVKALLDTGSPVSIVSLDFLLEVLAKQRPEGQTLKEWEESVRKRLEPPSMTLKSYGGEELPIVRQIECTVSREKYSMKATLQVQKGAPVRLLIGTDLQAKLGVLLLLRGKEQDEPAKDLLQGKEWAVGEVPVAKSPPEETPSSPLPAPVVRLIQATRLPARHVKLVRARVDAGTQGTPSLFEPAEDILEKRGLVMDHSLTEPDEDCCVVLAIHNPSFEPVHLEKDQSLGELQEAAELPAGMPAEPNAEDGAPTTIGAVDVETVEAEDPHIPVLPEGRVQQVLDALQLETADLNSQERAQLRELIIEYADLFALDRSELGSTDLVTHSINTSDHPPIRQQPRRVPFALRGKIAEMVDDMLEQGVIQPSQSPWASPVVLVAKKDGTTRFCVDYRKLNATTKMDVYPLPRIDDSLDLLAHTKYFSTLDLAAGYWQVKMDETSQEKTAFTTPVGLFEFRVMPFGLCNAPATFQRLMENVLAGLVGKQCLVYIDDILVIGTTFQEHIEYLRKVFGRLRQAGLRLKPTKCHLVQQEVGYLGYVVSDEGISADPKKIEAVESFPVPTDLTSLRSFLGLASYYRRFVPGFSKAAQPLYALTRKNVPFVWNASCQEAFDHLKQLLTEAPVLAFPDFEKDFILETDASGAGLGAVLSQEQEDGSQRPIAFASRTLQPSEKNYGVSEMEALGVVWATKHFRPYLYGHHCDVITDHEALKALLNTPQPSGKLARWGMALQELDLAIAYRSGRKNEKADALSRYPVPQESIEEEIPPVIAATTPSGNEGRHQDCLEERQRSDPELAEIIRFLEEGTLPDDDKSARLLVLNKPQYTMVEEVLYHVAPDKTLRIVPPVQDRQKLFREVHDGVFGGHLRDAKVHGTLSKHYWWPSMRTDVSAWCRSCLPCATRCVGRAVKPPLTPIPVAGPFDRIGVDVVQLPMSQNGNKYAIVFMDYLTKWPEVFAAKDQTALTIAQLLVEQIISRHGVPAELLSDRGAAFLSRLMGEVYSLMGIHKANTTAYHPQTDGLVERFNRTLINMLAKTVEQGGRDWDTRLPYVLFAYRTSLQQSTVESPFFLLYGRDPRLPTESALSPPQRRYPIDVDDYKSEVMTKMSDAWELARKNIGKAQSQQKRQHDRSSRSVKFAVGDRVFVYMPSAKSTKAHKFARPFHGPYRVLKTYDNGVEVCPVDKPQSPSIRVALNRVRHCPVQLPNEFWPRSKGNKPTTTSVVPETDHPNDNVSESELEPITKETPDPPVLDKPSDQSVWANRLRRRPRTSVLQPGEM